MKKSKVCKFCQEESSAQDDDQIHHNQSCPTVSEHPHVAVSEWKKGHSRAMRYAPLLDGSTFYTRQGYNRGQDERATIAPRWYQTAFPRSNQLCSP